METNNPLLIVVDPGHGGHDNGAQWQGRVEKDDNLRLGLAVRDALQRQNVQVLMTRDTDVFISLANRAQMANDADADLFVSLHRNSYTHQTPTSNGVENYIYLTAPEVTSGRAAQMVLDQVVAVGVQRDRGVSRGNYYVLRRTRMPAMLLEMGFIINDEDNRLFDQNLTQYAEAIACGVLQYFGIPFTPPAGMPVPPIGTLPPPSGQQLLTTEAQQALNRWFGAGLTTDGIYGPLTRAAAVRVLQQGLNDSLNINLAVDGVVGPQTLAHLPTLQTGDRGNMVALLQILLYLQGYNTGGIDGDFGPRTRHAVEVFQRDRFLSADGVAGPATFTALLR